MTAFRRAALVALLGAAALAPLARGAAAVGDTTPPTISPVLTGTVGANGWFTSSVDVSWTVSDQESAIASTSGCDAVSIADETAGTALSCTATNADGLAATATTTVKIDKTPPQVTGANPSSPPQRQGWHVAPVTFQFSGSDALSGIAGCTTATYAGPDAKSAVVTGSCSDNAGLTTPGTATLKYDASGPAIAPQLSGTIGLNGWYRSDVGVTWSVTDPQSGVWQSTGCTPSTVTGETGGTTVTCTAINEAGTQTASAVTVKIDRNAPDTTISGGPSGTVGTRDATFTFDSEPGAALECSLDGAAFAGCSSPQTYGQLSNGPHTFAVRAVDAAGNVDPSPSTRSWTVHFRVVLLSLPGDRLVEAVGPSGTKVTFAVSATSDGEPLAPTLIACSPASGSIFPLGRTIVTCTAHDSTGASASGSFAVTVADTIPPELTVPRPLTITSGVPVPAADPRLTVFAGGATAHDIVDAKPVVTGPQLPSAIPLGKTEFEFTARDAAGNVARATSSVTVLRPGEAPPPEPPTGAPSSPSAAPSPSATPDRIPPANVRLTSVRPGDGRVTLDWALPSDADLSHVELRRSTTEAGAARQLVYSGRGTTFTDRGLTNGVDYQFLFVTLDRSGNRARGIIVVATPKPSLLLAPKDGAVVRAPPLLRWTPVPTATYYNVQLHRAGKKILSVWPRTTRFRLSRSWRFGGTSFRLTPGSYRWYVWAGVGARVQKQYGPLLGEGVFVVQR
jgi:hypothetical protein